MYTSGQTNSTSLAVTMEDVGGRVWGKLFGLFLQFRLVLLRAHKLHTSPFKAKS